jgi:hypothetical protein
LAHIGTSARRAYSPLTGPKRTPPGRPHPKLTGCVFKSSAEHPLPSLEDVGDPVVAGLFDPALHPTRLLKGDDGSYRASLPIGDYIYIYRNISGFGQVRWSTMVAFPATVLESEFARLRLTAIGSLVLMGLAIAVAILLAHRIAKPITAFAALANQIGTLELDQAPRFPRSRVKEFDHSGQTLNAILRPCDGSSSICPRRLFEVCLLTLRSHRKAKLPSCLRTWAASRNWRSHWGQRRLRPCSMNTSVSLEPASRLKEAR